MHGKNRPGPRYESRVPFPENVRTVHIERLWRHEREVARARTRVGISVERSLDWLVLLSLARDWSQGLDPDVAATTAAVELPRTTVKRSLDGLAEREVVLLERCRQDGRRRLIRPGPAFNELFNPLFERVYDLLEDMREPVPEAARKIAESLVDAVLITDAPPPGKSPTIISANKAFTDLTGYSEVETVGQAPTMLQGEDTKDEAREEIRTAIDSRRGGSTTLVNYKKDGSPYLCHLTVTPIRDDSGAVRYFLGIARDIGNI